MKLTTQQKNLRQALHRVEKIISRNVALPILYNVLLKTENGRLKIAATNLEVGITTWIGAKIDETGEIAIPARVLSDFVNIVSEDTVTLTTKNNSVFINSAAYKTQILGHDTHEYPIIPKIKSDPLCTLPVAALRAALTATADSIAISETRPELAGLFFSFLGGEIVFSATDSFRLVEKKVNFPHTQRQTVIIPRNTVLELLHLTGELEGELEIRVGDNQISFTNNEVELISRLIDGVYPDYTKVIPEKIISKALISRNELEKHIRLAGLFSSSIADIHLSCEENTLHISAKNSEKGEVQTTIPAVLKNEPFGVSLNFNYFLDGLKIINTDKVVIEFTGNGSPLVLRPHSDQKDLVYLVMPLRHS